VGEEAYCYGIAADAATPMVLLAVRMWELSSCSRTGLPTQAGGIPPTVLDGCVLDTRAGIAAVGVNYAPDAKDMVIHVADLRTGATRAFPTRDPASRDPYAGEVASLGLAADGSLVSGGEEGVFRWDLATGERTRIFGEAHEDHRVMLNASGTAMVALVSQPWPSEVLVIDLLTGAQRRITSHGDTVVAAAMDATGTGSPPAMPTAS